MMMNLQKGEMFLQKTITRILSWKGELEVAVWYVQWTIMVTDRNIYMVFVGHAVVSGTYILRGEV